MLRSAKLYRDLLLGIKTLKITLDSNEYTKLIRAKGNKTWKEFLFDLIDFKREIEEEGELVPKESLKEPYATAAQALRKLGALFKTKHAEEGEPALDWEYEVAALLPLYVAGAELSEEERRRLLHLLANAIGQLVSELYPERSEEMEWISQALRMLALKKEEIYDLSIGNLCKLIRARASREGFPAQPIS